jgi:Cache 3/Cache 2 fusion domain
MGVEFYFSPERCGKIAYSSGGDSHMGRKNIVVWVLSVCLVALTLSVGPAQAVDVKTTMSDLQAAAALLGAPKVQGNDLYFGPKKVSSDLVDAIVTAHGGVATIFVKSGDKYVRAATTVKKEDGSSAVGTALAADSPALAKLNNGEPYYGDATVFGKKYDAGYEPIKDASGAVIGAYFVGQNK